MSFTTAKILEICAVLRKTKVYVKAMICKVFLIFKPSMGASHLLAARTAVPLKLGTGAAGQQVGEFLLPP